MKVVTKTILIDSAGNLLLLRRGKTHPNFPEHLDLLGGEVEDGEQWPNAVAREVFEETGIHIDAEKLKKEFELKHPNVIHALYRIKVDSEKPVVTLSWEHSGYSWMSFEQLIDIPLPDAADRYFVDAINYLKTQPRD